MRATRHRTKKVRGDSRRLPVRGKPNFLEGNVIADDSDPGRYFRCWNCDFVCDAERDELGDDQSKSGVDYEVYTKTDLTFDNGFNFPSDNPARASILLRTGHVLMLLGADGIEKTVRINYSPDVASGCPFCGTLNWRGDY